ncbi:MULTISPECIES: hypothetical protein [unclassified Microbacterium]|uniref:hypothetical protein n=1 Tax=unclassified Microbacterium TaxID=2609290 RepID=UPI000A43B437|nr:MULTISPECIES: hypothetical protein [unclassified Microbacterium]MBN9215688.1 hypothetical protein [Microbacterium sp.]
MTAHATPVSRHRAHGIGGALAALVLALTGCATEAPASTAPSATASIAATAEPVAAQGLSAEPVSGTGRVEFPGMDFPIPAGAQSLLLVFECDGSSPFSVELGGSMMLQQSPLYGTCGDTADLLFPVLAATQPKLTVYVDEGVAWTATPLFSTDPFPTETSLASDCSAFAAVYSAYLNADQGYGPYKAFGEDEWARRVGAATDDLAALAASSTSSIAPALVELHESVITTETALGAATPVAHEQIGVIMDACNVNQTPIVTSAEFGG